MLLNQYYSELGKLFYAIAEIDGKISQQEKEKLKELIRFELAPAEFNKDEYGSDAAFYAEMEFDILEDSMLEPEAAFESFTNFIDAHKTAIHSDMLNRVFRLAQKLADSYYHTNKKEQHLLVRLKAKLDSLLREKSIQEKKS